MFCEAGLTGAQPYPLVGVLLRGRLFSASVELGGCGLHAGSSILLQSSSVQRTFWMMAMSTLCPVQREPLSQVPLRNETLSCS